MTRNDVLNKEKKLPFGKTKYLIIFFPLQMLIANLDVGFPALMVFL